MSLYGREGIGKSFVALSLALCVASGTDWFGKTVTPADVVYVAGEGAHGMQSRIAAWQTDNRGAELSRFRLDPQPLDLLHRADVDAFIQTLTLYCPSSPVLVVLDTLSRCLAGADENSAKDMTGAVGAIDRLRANGSTVLVVHHAAKRGGERGHSAFAAAADTRIEVTAGPSLACVKQRNAPHFDPMHFRLTPAEQSCVVEEAGAATARLPA